MTNSLSLTQLILQASMLAQVVLGLLIAASIASWAVIFSKRAMLARSQKAAGHFEDRFWSGGNLADLYAQVSNHSEEQGLAGIFRAGYEEFLRQQTQNQGRNEHVLAAIQRQMRVSQMREIERLEGGLAMLATIGSTSPYVGLLGTVWGIMNAFISIGNVKQASLAMVAPGISEALVATAMGLMAAIPAVIAYNFFTRGIERLENRYHTFAEEMTGIIERSLRGQQGKV